MRSKKILHIVSVSFSLPYFIGNQFHFFKHKGYEMHVACSESQDLNSLTKEFGFKAFPVPILRNISPFQDLKSILQLRRYIIQEKIDIVIAHSPKGGLIGILASFLAGTRKRIFFRHGLVFETSAGFKKKMLIAVEKLIGFCATNVVNVSPSVAVISDKLSLNHPNKNILLGKGTCNGIDVNRFKFREVNKSPSTITVGFVGRLATDKGIVELVKAWDILRAQYSNISLLLVGPFDERDMLDEATVSRITSDSSIEYVGGVSDASLYYNRMDIFVLPSYREGFPTVTLEASASCLPIVTTKVTGCIDSIIENVTGVFCDNTADSIASKVKYYIDNPSLIKVYGENGRKFVCENFSEEFIYQEIENKLLS